MTAAATAPSDDAAARAELRTARLLVAGQFVLIGCITAMRRRTDWPVPRALAITSGTGVVAGAAVMAVGATSLGRGLTAVPLPNEHAQLRTGGLYQFVRHPIYSGLLLMMTSITAATGSAPRLVALGALWALLGGKSQWEESRLSRRFDGYAAYAARTPRFVPRLPR